MYSAHHEIRPRADTPSALRQECTIARRLSLCSRKLTCRARTLVFIARRASLRHVISSSVSLQQDQQHKHKRRAGSTGFAFESGVRKELWKPPWQTICTAFSGDVQSVVSGGMYHSNSTYSGNPLSCCALRQGQGASTIQETPALRIRSLITLQYVRSCGRTCSIISL